MKLGRGLHLGITFVCGVFVGYYFSEYKEVPATQEMALQKHESKEVMPSQGKTSTNEQSTMLNVDAGDGN